jgi:hypothetical protein
MCFFLCQSFTLAASDDSLSSSEDTEDATDEAPAGCGDGRISAEEECDGPVEPGYCDKYCQVRCPEGYISRKTVWPFDGNKHICSGWNINISFGLGGSDDSCSDVNYRCKGGAAFDYSYKPEPGRPNWKCGDRICYGTGIESDTQRDGFWGNAEQTPASPEDPTVGGTLAHVDVASLRDPVPPSDVGHLLITQKIEEQVLIPHQIRASVRELEAKPIAINLRTILEANSQDRENVRATLNILSNPSTLTLSVRLLNGEFFDDVISRQYRESLNTFEYTGLERSGYKFFQQTGVLAHSASLWRQLQEADGEEADRLFKEASSGGEVVILDPSGKLYRLTTSFLLGKLTQRRGIDGVGKFGESIYANSTSAGQSLASLAQVS